MKNWHRLALTLIAAATVAPLSPMGAAAQTADPVSASIRSQYASVKKNIVAAAITDAFAYCDAAYEGATDAAMGEEVRSFGSTAVRHYPLTFALVHANEHYGNIVTYMRLNGMVPPSSQGG